MSEEIEKYQTKIAELTLALSESAKRTTALQSEVIDIHNLLTAFGVVNNVEYKESYKSGNLSASARFALYVSGKSNE